MHCLSHMQEKHGQTLVVIKKGSYFEAFGEKPIKITLHNDMPALIIDRFGNYAHVAIDDNTVILALEKYCESIEK